MNYATITLSQQYCTCLTLGWLVVAVVVLSFITVPHGAHVFSLSLSQVLYGLFLYICKRFRCKYRPECVGGGVIHL